MTEELFTQIDDALDSIPSYLSELSGSVFSSGREAFKHSSRLYVLGLNPGGDPISQSNETIAADIQQFRTQPGSWSAYQDESWSGQSPGTVGMQPRVLHMFRELEVDPRTIPASNVFFVRSSTEASLHHNKGKLLQDCWDVHSIVIRTLGIDTIACFGGTAGGWVRKKLGANRLVSRYQETNLRGWTSEAHDNSNGTVVLTLSHPSRANWCDSDSDPTALVKEMLNRR